MLIITFPLTFVACPLSHITLYDFISLSRKEVGITVLSDSLISPCYFCYQHLNVLRISLVIHNHL